MNRITLTALFAASSALALATIAPQAPAGELNPRHVPADAKWLVHLDLEQILATKLADRVRENRPEITRFVREWLQAQYGIDPQNDLRGATMFSRSYHSYTGTIVLQANYDPAKVEADIQKGDEVQTTSWQDHTLYTVTLAKHRAPHMLDDRQNQRDDVRAANAPRTPDNQNAEGHDHSGGKQMTIVLVDRETILLASSVENAQETLQLLAGDGESLEGSDSFLLTDAAKQAMAHGAAIDLNEIEKSNTPMPILQQHQRIRWTLREQDGKVREEATLVADSEEVAKEMEQVLEGLLAYGRLWAGDSQPVKEMVQAAQISRDGETVNVQWEVEGDQVLAALDELKHRASRR